MSRVRGSHEDPPPNDAARLKVRIQGFDLDAQVAFDGRDRKRLERMVRYLARPALSNERLTKMDDGRIRVVFKQAWSDGTASILLSPKDLIARLAALVPPPKFHLLRFFGVLSAHHHLRSQVIPKPYQPPPRPPLQLALFEGGSLLDPLDHRNGTSTGDAQPVRPGKAGPKGMRVR